MEYRVEWSAKAISDLGEHIAFQKRVSIEAAQALSEKIISMGASLASFPERFPVFPMPQNFPIPVRKCVVDGRYILLYGLSSVTVVIFRVLDARRKFDGLLAG